MGWDEPDRLVYLPTKFRVIRKPIKNLKCFWRGGRSVVPKGLGTEGLRFRMVQGSVFKLQG